MDQNRSQVAGIVLVVLGGLLLLGQGLDMGEFAWPLFVLVPGLVLVGVGDLGGEAVFCFSHSR